MAEPILTVEHLIKAYGETPCWMISALLSSPARSSWWSAFGLRQKHLLRCLNGLEPTQSGRVRLGNETVATAVKI